MVPSNARCPSRAPRALIRLAMELPRAPVTRSFTAVSSGESATTAGRVSVADGSARAIFTAPAGSAVSTLAPANTTEL